MEYSIANGFLVLIAVAIVSGFLFVGRILFPRINPPPFSAPARELYVANHGGNSILGFELNENGRISTNPLRKIEGYATGLQNPIDVTVDRLNRIWVANLGPAIPGVDEPFITVYAEDAHGDAPPLFTIQSVSISPGVIPLDSLRNPIALVRRNNPANVLVANGIEGEGTVVEFSTSAALSPSTPMLSQPSGGLATGLSALCGIALDSSGMVFVSDPTQANGGEIRGFVVQANSFVSPAFTISITGSNSGLDNPGHIWIDGTDKLFVINRSTTSNPNPLRSGILIFSPGANGNVAPARTISSIDFMEPFGIAVDEAGRIYASDISGRLVAFPSGADGNVSADQVILHSDLNNPTGLTIRA
ncbi:hypothetical protein [Synechococcus sp. 1G10]|uniref:hypothetical protein n=1 Tax=Synechococcus sp. 1G10 TaxID=2025605 RepID=UPI00117F98CB|nr:hypothetical protein [Synechococcus sp. 1G10]